MRTAGALVATTCSECNELPPCPEFADQEPVDCVDRIEQSKKAGKPMSLSLRPNFDLLAELKTLSILFLDDNGMEFLLVDARSAS